MFSQNFEKTHNGGAVRFVRQPRTLERIPKAGWDTFFTKFKLTKFPDTETISSQVLLWVYPRDTEFQVRNTPFGIHLISQSTFTSYFGVLKCTEFFL